MHIELVSTTRHTDSDIIAAQLFSIVGGGMRINVYAKRPTKCPICKSQFELRKFRCPNHKYVRPERLRIQISGVKGVPQGIRICSDLDGNPLTFINTPILLEEIRKRIAKETFRAKDFLPQDRSRFLYKNYVKNYLKDMLSRAEDVPKGADGWLSGEAYTEIEKYQRLYLVPSFGKLELADIKLTVIKKFLRSLKSVKTKEPASDTIKIKAKDALRHMLFYAVEEEDIFPLSFKFPKIEKPKRTLYTLSDNQQDEVISFISESRKPIFKFAKKTPHRTNEYRAIRVKDINFLKKSYWLNGTFDLKTNYKPFLKIKKTTGAEYAIDKETEAIFREALKGRDVTPDDFIFINPRKNTPYTHHQLNAIYKRASKKAGFDKVTLEMFGRHSWVTKKLSEGWNFTDISHWTLNTISVLQDNYANVTKATRQSVIQLKPEGKKVEGVIK